jgi:hypothetical protein
MNYMRTAVRPTHSLCQTHCGMRLKGRDFILGFLPHAATARLAQTLGFTGKQRGIQSRNHELHG